MSRRSSRDNEADLEQLLEHLSSETDVEQAVDLKTKNREIEIKKDALKGELRAKVSNGNQQSPTVTKDEIFNGNQQSPTVTKKAAKTSLTVTNGNPLTVINGNQKRWRNVFCLPLKFFNETQPDNVPKPTTNNDIAAATGLAHGTVKNALTIATSLGFLENAGGNSGRWRPIVRRKITPLGYALMASDYYRDAIEDLTVTNSNQRSPVNGNQRSPMTDRQNLISQLNLSDEWMLVGKSKIIPGLTPERLAGLLSQNPNRWTPEDFMENARVWNHRKKADKKWYAKIIKSEWKVFSAEMLNEGGIDPRPGYKNNPEQESPKPETVEADMATEAERRDSDAVNSEYEAFMATEEGQEFKKLHKEPWIAWLKKRTGGIFKEL